MSETAIHLPADWAPRTAIWTAWPSHPDLWGDGLAQARAEVAGMALALAGGDRVRMIAAGPEAAESARAALGDAVEVIAGAFGDIWFRDTGPIFAQIAGAPAALGFRFNGWGGKYDLPGDERVAAQIAAAAGVTLMALPFVLEGGAIEPDGEGTLLTTRQCLLNENRNPGWGQTDVEAQLRATLGIETVLWLDEGLANDHTDGHVDNLARFVAPGHVVCQAPAGVDDPNLAVLRDIARALSEMTDAKGRRLTVTQIPGPGLVPDADGEAMPASHMNFVIGTRTVVVPTYNAQGQAAVAALSSLFPGRAVLGLPANALLAGGGAFHCITKEEPA